MDLPQDRPGRSKAVKLDTGLKQALKEFLDTERARKLGYKRETDVVNAAVRALLERYHFEIEDSESNDSGENTG
jgi:hypothetical protein